MRAVPHKWHIFYHVAIYRRSIPELPHPHRVPEASDDRSYIDERSVDRTTGDPI